MSVVRYSAPTNPFPKPNGMWAVDHFPKGVRTEYGEYPDEKTAQKVFEILTSAWLANDPAYVEPRSSDQ